MTVTAVPHDPTEKGAFAQFVARGLHWPLLVVVLLLIPVIAGGYLAYKATHDPTFAIESDYYRKAVAWDATMAQEQSNAKLGWHSVVSVKPDGEGLNVFVRLQDKAGLNVSDAKVHVEGFFLARGGDLQAAEAPMGADGAYHATLKLSHAGLHEIRVRATQGADVFTHSHRLDVIR